MPNKTQRELQREDMGILDPVAIIRAANGDRVVYDNLTKYERLALFEWLTKLGGIQAVNTTTVRLGIGRIPGDRRGDGTPYHERAKRRIAEGRDHPFDLGPWEDLYRDYRLDTPAPLGIAYRGHNRSVT